VCSQLRFCIRSFSTVGELGFDVARALVGELNRSLAKGKEPEIVAMCARFQWDGKTRTAARRDGEIYNEKCSASLPGLLA